MNLNRISELRNIIIKLEKNENLILNKMDIKEILKLELRLSLFKEYILDKNLIPDDLLIEILKKNVYQFQYIPVERQSIEILNKIIDLDLEFKFFQNQLNLENLLKIDISLFNKRFNMIKNKNLKFKIINTLIAYNGFEDLDPSHCTWEIIKDKQFISYDLLIKNYEKNGNFRHLEELKEKNKMIFKFYELLINDDFNIVEYMFYQYCDTLINSINKYLENNNYDYNEIICLLKTNYLPRTTLDILKKSSLTIYQNIDSKLVEEEEFLIFLKTFINGFLEESYSLKTNNNGYFIHNILSEYGVDSYLLEDIIMNLLSNPIFITEENIKLMFQKNDNKFLEKVSYYLTDYPEFLTDDNICKMLSINKYDFHLNLFYKNNRINKKIIEFAIETYGKKYVKNELLAFIPTILVYLLDVSELDNKLQLIEESFDNFYKMDEKDYTDDFINILKTDKKYVKKYIVEMFNNSIIKLNPKYLYIENIYFLINRKRFEDFRKIMEEIDQSFLLDETLNKYFANNKETWKYINVKYYNNDKILYNMLKLNNNNIIEIKNYLK